jgi:hypothetical protein
MPDLTVKPSPPDRGRMVPELMTGDLDEAFAHACRQTCQLLTTALEHFPEAGKQAVLRAMTQGQQVDVTFSLKSDGTISVVSAMGSTELFTINSRRDRERDH